MASVVLALAQLALLLATLLACLSSADLSAKGGDVEISSSPPADHGYPAGSCESKGYIVGHGGGFLGGWVSNDKLVEYAMNDLRNKASELEANYVEHDSPQMGVTGGSDGTTTTTATVSGTAYACDESAKITGSRKAKSEAKAKAKPKERPAPRYTPVPEGAAGFKFGMAATQAEERCATAGFTFRRDGARGGCSGTPSSVGAPASAALHFCEDAVCGIDVLVALPAEELLTQYDALYERLEQKYGKPKRPREPVSETCKSALEECLTSKAPRGALWKWPDGHRVRLDLAAPDGTALVRVGYRTPQGFSQEEPGPAL